MEFLPSDILNIICSYLPVSSKAMFAFTCRTFAKYKPNIESLLNCCIQEQEYKFVQYISTYTKWSNNNYWTLGAFGNTAILHLRLNNMKQEQLLHLAKGIVAKDNTKLSSFLVLQCRHNTIIPMLIKECVLTGHTNMLRRIIYYRVGPNGTITDVAVNIKDGELLQFCYEQNPHEVRRFVKEHDYRKDWVLEQLGLCNI